MTGQMRTVHRWADQEPAQAHHAMEVIEALRLGPRHPPVPGRHPPGGGAKPRSTKPAMRRTDEIPDLAPGEGRHPMRVFTRDQRVPQCAVRARGHHRDPQIIDLRRMRRDPDRFCDIGGKLTRGVVECRRTARRQDNVGYRLGQRRQRLHAARDLQPAGGVDERKFLTHPPSQGPSAVKLLLRQDRGNPRALRRTAQGAADLRLRHSGTGIQHRIHDVQTFLS